MKAEDLGLLTHPDLIKKNLPQREQVRFIKRTLEEKGPGRARRKARELGFEPTKIKGLSPNTQSTKQEVPEGMPDDLTKEQLVKQAEVKRDDGLLQEELEDFLINTLPLEKLTGQESEEELVEQFCDTISDKLPDLVGWLATKVRFL